MSENINFGTCLRLIHSFFPLLPGEHFQALVVEAAGKCYRGKSLRESNKILYSSSQKIRGPMISVCFPKKEPQEHQQHQT